MAGPLDVIAWTCPVCDLTQWPVEQCARCGSLRSLPVEWATLDAPPFATKLPDSAEKRQRVMMWWFHQPLKLADVIARPSHVPFSVGCGGGLNTFAMLALLHRKRVRPDIISFADTGTEKRGTYKALVRLNDWLKSVGFPELVIVRKVSPQVGDKTLEEECLRRETLPSRAFGMSGCAQRWKIEPQEKMMNHWLPAKLCRAAGDKPIKALGYDLGEARRRGTTFEDDKLRYYYLLPEFGLDRFDCARLVLEVFGFLPPKSACFHCPSMEMEEIVELGVDYPDLQDRALHIEDVALASDKHELKTVRGLGRHWAWRHMLSLPPAERAKLPSSPVEACTACHLDGGGADLLEEET